MPKKYWLSFLILLAFILVSCSRTLPNFTETEELSTENQTELGTEEEKETSLPQHKDEVVTSEEPETSKPPITTLPPPTTEKEPPATVHVHAYRVVSIRQATCTTAGQRMWRCSCGESKNEYLPALTHRFSEPSCTAPSVCSLCGVQKNARLGHDLQGNTCTRCQKTISAPIYVLGQELHFDATRANVEEALGTPTEVLTEGVFVSLVYAVDPAQLTVIQLDDVGLWGVFTLDPEARFFLDGKTISISDYSGTKDLTSDAYYWDIGSCRIFGFRDNLVSKAFYGLWLRYSECRYDYMNDPAVASSYLVQSRLSWYYTNALRAMNGLSTLVWSDAAAKVATDYSKVMAERENLDHDGSFVDRLKNEGVFWKAAVGENISRGYYNLYFICDAYYNSESHRENILHVKYTHVGMGYYQTALQKDVYGAQIYYG